MIDKVIQEMKAMGDLLVDYSFPKVSSQEEDIVSFLKTRDMVIDGYAISIHYGKATYPNHILETFQCLGQRTPFVPFFLVVKLVRKFLGDKHLCFLDLFLNDKKVYCWTVSKDLDGKELPTEQRVLKEMNFEGFRYSFLHPSSVNFI